MASVHRQLYAPPCQNCQTPPSPPPPPAAIHRVPLPTNMIVMVSTLGGFFFLAVVCTVARLYCLKRIESRRRNRNLAVLFDDRTGLAGEERGPAVDHPIWLINFVGLTQSAIDSITVCTYKKGEGLIEGTECSVCLSEFEENESVRLLPKCSHAFHIPCIDTWLRSHKNCPLCRAPVVGNLTGIAQIDRQEAETQIESSDTETETESDLDRQNRVEEGNFGNEIDLGFGSESRIGDEIGRNSKNWVSMGSNSGENGKLGEVKRQSLKNSGNGSSSLGRLMRSASSGRVVQMRSVSSVSMMKRCSSGSSENLRTQDSILPL